MTPFTVLWDGRRNGPGGAYLEAETEVTRTDTPLVSHRPLTKAPTRDLVRRALQLHGPQTIQELRERIERRGDLVYGALYLLQTAGEVHVVGERRRASHYGRTVQKVYAFKASE